MPILLPYYNRVHIPHTNTNGANSVQQSKKVSNFQSFVSNINLKLKEMCDDPGFPDTKTTHLANVCSQHSKMQTFRTNISEKPKQNSKML